MSRLSKAFFAALALHGSLLLLHARRVRPHAPPLRAPEELVVIEDTLEDEPPRAPLPEPSSATATQEMSPLHASRTPTPAHLSTGNSVAVGAASESGASAASDTDSDRGVASATPDGAPPSSGKPERKIDFGIDDGFFMRPPSEQMPRVKKPVYMQQLQNALSADDVRRGLARGNALLGSLNAAARELGPVRGEALLSVTVGADGSLSSAELLRGRADEWSSVLASFRELVARKRVRVPPGAHGVRVVFSVSAKVQRPSGKEVDASGIDITPNGTLRHTFDVSDLGAGTQRLVYAHVVSEEVL